MKDASYKAAVILSVTYIGVISFFLIIHGSWFSPDQFFAVALLATLLLGRSKQFIRDWFPFVGLLLAYEYLRALVPKLGEVAHIYPMIRFDTAVFGFIPSVKLQTLLFNVNSIQWYDYVAVLTYISYFIVPLFVGFIFWLNDRNHFQRYVLALLLLHYSAWVTFVVFPAMPPWMASAKGIIPPIIDVASRVSATFPHGLSLPTLYQFVGANLVAAVPSLHSAYPWMLFLFVAGKSKFWGLILLLYSFAVWFAVVYLGEHYVFDILIGWLYATTIFLLVTHWHKVLHFFSDWHSALSLTNWHFSWPAWLHIFSGANGPKKKNFKRPQQKQINKTNRH